MMVCAQTNAQLYRQLGEAGYASGEIERVASGYELALRPFTAAFRASMDAEARRRDMRARRAACVEMADALGGRALRDELAAAFAAVDQGDVPAALRRRQDRRSGCRRRRTACARGSS